VVNTVMRRMTLLMRQRAGGPRNRGSIHRRDGRFVCFSKSSQPALEPSQVKWVLSLEIKRPGREAYHRTPPGAMELYLCSYVSLAWCLIKHRDYFIFVVFNSVDGRNIKCNDSLYTPASPSYVNATYMCEFLDLHSGVIELSLLLSVTLCD
jgi:hypothetical protein